MKIEKDINRNKLNQAINFIEELSWLFEKKKNISLNDIVEYLRNSTKDQNSPKTIISTNYLVGVLPSLFLDNELFRSTEELLDFAESVLDLTVSRASKRSRTEYIGWIVCEVAKSGNSKLQNLVSSLDKIIGNDQKMKQVKEAKKSPNFSWNDTIKKLSEK